MKFVELKKSLTSDIAAAYVIGGDDRYLCYNALEQIEKSLALQFAEMNRVDLQDALATQIVDACNIYPFGDKFRLVIVHDYAPKSAQDKEKQILENYLSNPMKSTVLVLFCADDWTFARKLNNTIFVDCSKLDTATVCKYIAKSFDVSGIEYEQNAINLLALYCLYDMQRVVGEVEKLCCYLAGGKRLTEDVVKQMVVQDKEYQIFSLAEYIAKNDQQKALDLVENLSLKGGFGVLNALYNNYRRLLYIAVTKSSDSDLAEKLGTKEFAIKMSRNQLGVFSPRKIKQIVDMLAKFDADIKQGKIKENIAIKLSVIEIFKIRNS